MKAASIYNRMIFNRTWTKPLIPHVLNQFYSTVKTEESTLKHSRFSKFMGLASQLHQLQKVEQKEEKSQIRFNLSIIGICIIGFSCVAILVAREPSIQLKASFLIKKVQLGLNSNQDKRRQAIKEMMLQVKDFLKKYPYDYASTQQMLSNILNDIENLQTIGFEQELLKIYLYILQRNLKAGQNRQFLEGISSLLEHCSCQKYGGFPRILIEVLLENGTLKQMFLASKCLEGQKISQQLKQKVRKNMQIQTTITKKYFGVLFDEIEQEEIPHIQWKKTQTLEWSKSIQQRLKL